jgi:plastocyanin
MRFVTFLLFLAHGAVAATVQVSMINNRFSPADITINVGDTVTWRCVNGQHDTVSGSRGSADGVWNSGLLSAGQSFSFTFNNPNTYPYYCTPHWFQFNMVGTVRVLPVNRAPTISITSPPDQANFSAPADITVEANVSDPDGDAVSVEFFMNGTSIGVVSGPPYRVTVNSLDAGNYTFAAVATDTGSATSSASVSVTVSGLQPTVTVTPQSQTANAGNDVTFTAQATGSPPLNYQWSFGANPIAGATSSSLLLTNVAVADSGTYTVQVSNAYGSASASATLTVTSPPAGTPPTITTHPQSQTVSPGANVTFTAGAIGSTPLIWQWFFNGAPITDATNSSLQIANISLANAGNYLVTVNNAFGSATSSTATLTVCDFTLSKTSASFDAGGGSDSVGVTTPADCTWDVINTNAWISIPTSHGIGPGAVSFSVASNSTLNVRSGVLIIAGNAFTVTQAAAQFPAKNDFNHDGQTDFLWQNVDGRVRLWLMDGVNRISTLILRNGRPAPLGARIVGTHDFDLDGNVDILWQYADGSLRTWFMNGTNYLRTEIISPAPVLGRAWQAVGLGDLDGDLHADIVFRHSQGYLLFWYMRGKAFLRQELYNNGKAISPLWRVAGVADVNNDGYSDILWQRSDSAIVIWFMTPALPATAPLLSHLPRINARIVGLNDLDHDGQVDFIWRHPAGQLSVWWMQATNRLGSFPISQGERVPLGWTFAAPGN